MAAAASVPEAQSLGRNTCANCQHYVLAEKLHICNVYVCLIWVQLPTLHVGGYILCMQSTYIVLLAMRMGVCTQPKIYQVLGFFSC